jgi:hypothetical protein
VFGSGTQGLQSRTRSPPPRLVTPELAAVSVLCWGRGSDEVGDPPSIGGCTMYWYGIVIRWGEHELQTTRPHFLRSR